MMLNQDIELFPIGECIHNSLLFYFIASFRFMLTD